MNLEDIIISAFGLSIIIILGSIGSLSGDKITGTEYNYSTDEYCPRAYVDPREASIDKLCSHKYTISFSEANVEYQITGRVKIVMTNGTPDGYACCTAYENKDEAFCVFEKYSLV